MNAEKLLDNPVIPDAIRNALKTLMDACMSERVFLTMVLEIPMKSAVGTNFIMVPIAMLPKGTDVTDLVSMGHHFISKGVHIMLSADMTDRG